MSDAIGWATGRVSVLQKLLLQNLLGWCNVSGWSMAFYTLWRTPYLSTSETRVQRVPVCPVSCKDVQDKDDWKSRGNWLIQVYLDAVKTVREFVQ